MGMQNSKLIIAFLFISCLSFAQMPGSDTDKYGCIGSAGYTYSQIKKECIQIFNEDIKLSSTGEESYSTQSCVIFNENKKKAEVFLSNEVNSFVLKRKQKDGKVWWEKSGIQLSEINGGYELKKDGVLIYKS